MNSSLSQIAFWAVLIGVVGVTLSHPTPLRIPEYVLTSAAEASNFFNVANDTVASEATTTQSILFLGDILLARNVELLMDMFGSDYPFKNISNQLQEHDLVFGNFESAVATRHVRTKAYTTTFTSAPWYLDTLVKAGVTHVSLANNHAFDFGQVGYVNAQAQLAERSIGFFGHPNTVQSAISTTTIIVNGQHIGLLGVNAVFTKITEAEINTALSVLNESTDQQIVFVHWGDEYIQQHNRSQETLAKLFVKAGADIVIGHHPHVAQDIGIIDGVPVFYSLGNFLFDQYFSNAVQTGYMLALVPAANGFEFEIIPITSLGSRSQPRLMEETGRQEFLDAMAARSSLELKEYILNGKGFLEFSLATSS